MKKQTVVTSAELLHFAEKELGISWNACHDIFYQGHETLYSPESSNKTIDIIDVEDTIQWSNENKEHKYYNANKEKTCEILKSFMLAHNLSEMLVVSGK